MQRFIAGGFSIAAALEPQATPEQHQLKAPVLAGVDFKAAGHGAQLLGMDYLKDSLVGAMRQPAGTVPNPAGPD